MIEAQFQYTRPWRSRNLALDLAHLGEPRAACARRNRRSAPPPLPFAALATVASTGARPQLACGALSLRQAAGSSAKSGGPITTMTTPGSTDLIFSTMRS